MDDWTSFCSYKASRSPSCVLTHENELALTFVSTSFSTMSELVYSDGATLVLYLSPVEASKHSEGKGKIDEWMTAGYGSWLSAFKLSGNKAIIVRKFLPLIQILTCCTSYTT